VPLALLNIKDCRYYSIYQLPSYCLESSFSLLIVKENRQIENPNKKNKIITTIKAVFKTFKIGITLDFRQVRSNTYN